MRSGYFFTARCRVVASRIKQRQLLYILPPAIYNLCANKNQIRVLPFGIAIAHCSWEAAERSSCHVKNTPSPQLINLGRMICSSRLLCSSNLTGSVTASNLSGVWNCKDTLENGLGIKNLSQLLKYQAF